MPIFQFFEKNDVVLQLVLNTATFSSEEEQLLTQGFQPIGDAIDADNAALAHVKFNAIQSGKKSLFHFFEKDDVVVHLNINSPSFDKEKEQLIEQGFERIGEVVHAHTVQQAYQKFQKMQLDELNTSSTFLGAATSSGAGNFLRFATELKTKSDLKKKNSK